MRLMTQQQHQQQQHMQPNQIKENNNIIINFNFYFEGKETFAVYSSHYFMV